MVRIPSRPLHSLRPAAGLGYGRDRRRGEAPRIGWVPYFLERADFSNSRHKYWTHSLFNEMKPSEIFKRHFLNCFIDDAFGLKNLEDIGEDMVAYECDYPHSDSLWPEVPERLYQT